MIDNVMVLQIENLGRLIQIEYQLNKLNSEEILITDEDNIKEKVGDHFQNCAGTISVDKELSVDWLKEYDSVYQTHISYQAYDRVLEKILIEEILEAIKELPNRKATGPSNITYKNIKLIILSLKEYVQKIFNDILDSEEIPQQWLKANIYLISKLKLWEYNLNNTVNSP